MYSADGRSAFDVDHGAISKLAVRRQKPLPEQKLQRGKIRMINASHKVVAYGAGPSPLSTALRSVTPLRAVLGH